MKKIFNNKGIGMVDLLLSSFIISLVVAASLSALINLYAVNKANKDKFNAGYVGNTVLLYLRDTPFQYYRDLIDNSATGYVKLDATMCTNPTFTQATCEAALNPIINNLDFNTDTLYFYIYPFANQTVVDAMAADPNMDSEIKYFINTQWELPPGGDKTHIIRVAMIMRVNDRDIILLHGALYEVPI